jgi:hypothetical protein
MPAAAPGANSFEQDVEINATGTLDRTPDEIRAAEYLMIHEARFHGWAVNLSTFPGHTLIDAVFDNPTYDRNTGPFHAVGGQQPYLGKVDPPQELDQVMVYAARDLAAKLNTGIGYHVLTSSGAVHSYGVPWYGSDNGKLPAGITAVAIATDPATGGYWILASSGGVDNYNAPWHGSVNGQVPIGQTVTSIAGE